MMKMKKYAPIFLIGAAVLSQTSPARAAEVVFNGSMSGTSTGVRNPSCAPLLFTSTLIGTGTSSLGNFSYMHAVCLSGPGPINGNFTLDFSAGNTLLGSIIGAATTTPTAGLFDIAFDYSILGGTGLYAGATGVFKGIGTVDQRVRPTNVAINFSAVPEPGTWAMMLIGFGAIGATIRFRRRQSGIAGRPQLA